MLNRGEPGLGGGMISPLVIENEKLADNNDDGDNDNDDDANNSSEEDSSEPNFMEKFLGKFVNFDRIRPLIENAISKGKGLIFMSQTLDNGTTIEKTIETDPSNIEDPFSSNGNEMNGLKLFNALLGRGDEKEKDDDKPINWKGIPMPIGKQIVERIDNDENDMMMPPYLRQCHELRFHLKTLCSDINRFFACASLRTGLPRWFFLSLMLTCSAFMIWLGIFVLSMIRRMKKNEVSHSFSLSFKSMSIYLFYV